ncbi:helix-turn-helix domain-containing protein [Clostridium kluyveri]|uniref:HTH cro/C1-type domain-containing protein n=2 Tax=Clostridium kluyveri TaxID=1534 RepID=A5MYS9_CLOK5|nr:helix-turn-helix transcriptional regulator [Clostridium kluyveri]EDK34025.1 Hypothetical protein CKL_2013 [Clostridium kluyveri DSM 555]BAH06812.1 hypothetical protein CKR_1761 [Clostridium kluyveri NBRC 12016]
MNFGTRLSELIDKFNISTYKLSKLSGVAQSTISDIVNGRNKNPSLETLLKFSSSLNITLSELIGETELKLTPDLKELVDGAKDLTPEQLELLSKFIQSLK